MSATEDQRFERLEHVRFVRRGQNDEFLAGCTDDLVLNVPRLGGTGHARSAGSDCAVASGEAESRRRCIPIVDLFHLCHRARGRSWFSRTGSSETVSPIDTRP